jgi:Flp pilus assembly protein TadG
VATNHGDHSDRKSGIGWSTLISRLLRGESAQAVVFVALAMAVIMGFVGLAVDIGQLRFVRQKMQTAADAAAIAGALEINACSGGSNCAAMQTAAQSSLAENGFSSSTLLTNCASSALTTLTITVNRAPCGLAKTQDPHNGNTNYVEVLLSQSQPLYFARILGISSVALTTRAEAGLAGGSNCIYALDPTGSGALHVQLLAALVSKCGIVVESNSNSALQCDLLAAISASQIGVVGKASSFLCALSPSPKTHITMPSPADPLAYLTKPAVPSCGVSHTGQLAYHGSDAALNLSGASGNVVLWPDGAYCGGINIQPGAHVTFQPGTYALTSKNGGTSTPPGGLTVDLGTTVTASGVTLYNYGPSGGITFNFSSFTFGGVNMTAPTSGTYSGILFFQDPGNTSQALIVGTSSWNTVLQGSYYFPSAAVTFAFDGLVDYNILVAKDITFEALSLGGTTINPNFNNNYSSLANGSPINGTGAVLVQ